MVQEHWLNNVLHSEKAGMFSQTTAPLAKAASFGDGVPPVGQGVDVTCQVCADPKVHWTAQLRSQYGCDTKCKPAQNQQQTQQNQNQTNPNQSGQGASGSTAPNKGSGSANQGSSNNSQNSTQTGNSSSANSPGTGTRKICIGTGGTSNRTNNGPATNVYCVEDVISATNEIEASAIGFTSGAKGADTQWNQAWGHAEGGLGVISQGQTTNSSGHSPTVQTFYDSCKAKGGIVGGAGTVKAGLPTTESGYTCEYKSNTPKNGTQPCWDYLTYSGGRYMGGNTGCPAENLLPTDFDEQKVKALGSKWDGNYAVSGGTIKCAGDFAYTIPIPAVVAPVRNNIMSTTQGPLPINGSSVVWSMSISSQQDNATVSVSEIDTFQFFQSGSTVGVRGTYSANITASGNDQVKVSSCYGTIGGARQ